MVARIVSLVLLGLLGLIHQQLWQGAASVEKIEQLQSQIDHQEAANEAVRQELKRLGSEVENLRSGQEAVEEKARSELGMVKPGEIYVHIIP